MRPLVVLAVLCALAGVVLVADVPALLTSDTARRACLVMQRTTPPGASSAHWDNCDGTVSPRPGYALLGAAVVLLLLDQRRRASGSA